MKKAIHFDSKRLCGLSQAFAGELTHVSDFRVFKNDVPGSVKAELSVRQRAGCFPDHEKQCTGHGIPKPGQQRRASRIARAAQHVVRGSAGNACNRHFQPRHPGNRFVDHETFPGQPEMDGSLPLETIWQGVCEKPWARFGTAVRHHGLIIVDVHMKAAVGCGSDDPNIAFV